MLFVGRAGVRAPYPGVLPPGSMDKSRGKMPRIYRSMRIEGGKPALGRGGASLGIRPGFDLPVDEDNEVRPSTGGMSVAPTLSDLPEFLVPKRLRGLVPRARGKDSRFVWS